MSEREISWGDEEQVEEIISVPVPAVAVVVEKKERAPLPVPKWSVDTRADLSTEQALNSAAPSWPEEESAGSTSDYNSGYEAAAPHTPAAPAPQWDQQEPLNRRPGRGPSRGEPARESREPREFLESREPMPMEPRGNSRSNRYDDLSTINLPGVDLSKMPESTTRLSFSNGNSSSRRDDREDRPPRREENNRERDRDVGERVERISKEIEELSWCDDTVETVRVSEPVRAFEPVREPVRLSEPARTVESVRQYASTAAPVKVSNVTSRLEDDGWDDEPEEPVFRAPEPVFKTEAVRVSETFVSKPVETAVATIPAETVVSKPAEIIAPVTATPVASAPTPVTAPPAPAHSYSHAHTQSQSPPHQYMRPTGYPYMMNPMMSPTGQMPIPAPMSCMPGMMMPIWVTCPFCYHCYMYPPVAPGSGPAPGATIQQQQN